MNPPADALAGLVARVEQLECRLAALERKSETQSEARLTVRAAAGALGCDVETIRRLVRQGKLRGTAIRYPGRARRKWVVFQRSLRALIAESEAAGCTTGARAAPIGQSAGAQPGSPVQASTDRGGRARGGERGSFSSG